MGRRPVGRGGRHKNPARSLFVLLAEAVVFAMLASYMLSGTLVPTMSKYLLRGHEHDVERHSRWLAQTPVLRGLRVPEGTCGS